MRRLRYYSKFIPALVLFVFGCNQTDSVVQRPATDQSNPLATKEPQSKTNPSTKGATQPEDVAGKLTIPNPEVPKPDVPKPEVSQPTTEQIAKWKRLPYEPMQLLAFRSADGAAEQVAATGDGKHFLVAGPKITRWAIDNEQPDLVFTTPEGKADYVKSIEVSPDSTWCVAGTETGTLRVVNIEGKKELVSTSLGSKPIELIAISPDGLEIAVFDSSKVHILNAVDLEIKRTLSSNYRRLSFLGFSAPQELLVGGDDLVMVDTQTGSSIRNIASLKSYSSVGLSPNRKMILFGIEDALQRWNVEDAKAMEPLVGAFTSNEMVRFSPDGKCVATISDSMIRIWDVATGQLLQFMDDSGSTIQSVAWLPKTNLLIVASDSGQIRIWGKPDDGIAFGLKPILPTVDLRSVDLRSIPINRPATVAECLAAIDLRLLPALSPTKPTKPSFWTDNYKSAASIDEVQVFYRYTLNKLGWTETQDPFPEGALKFAKQGFVLHVSSTKHTDTECFVSLSLLGNTDLRSIPRLKVFAPTIEYDNCYNVVYHVKAGLIDIETELLRLFHDAGWTAVSRLANRRTVGQLSRNLDFIWNATLLQVSIDPDKGNPGSHTVSCYKTMTLHSLPIPPDCGLVEWDDWNGRPGLFMDANTSMSMDQAKEFYETKMISDGWIPTGKRGELKADAMFLPFIRGENDVTIGLETLPSGRVRIRAGRYSDKSWQSKPLADTASNATDESTDELEAADLPIIDAAAAPTYDRKGSRIKYSLRDVPLAEVSEKYVSAMKQLGWSAVPFGDPTLKQIGLHFKKDRYVLHFSASIDPVGEATIQIKAIGNKGIAWKKIIRSKHVTSYIEWLKENQHMATLDLLNTYRGEMAMRSQE